jgi:hypothetical protein
VGHVKIGENVEQPHVVIEIPSETFKVVGD